MSVLETLLQRLTQERAVLVQVSSTQGSVPREVGAWMAVFEHDTLGSVGGGHVEYEAAALARRVLAGKHVGGEQRFALGPSLGQCCGGVMKLLFTVVGAVDGVRLRLDLATPRTSLALFGGGHVGRAIVRVLSDLPFAIRWVDSRDEIFPPGLNEHVCCEHSDPVAAAVADLVPFSRVLIMSFSHAEDLDIVAACLQRQRARADLPFIGLIGSQTKWASFQNRLRARGFDDAELAHITCPIGVPGIHGKEPEVIAVAVAAQLLQYEYVGTRAGTHPSPN